MATKAPFIVSVANRKGGVGKSTVSVLLAAALAKERKKQVVVIDADDQQSVVELYQSERVVFPDERPLFDVAPMPPGDVPAWLAQHAHQYDVIVIDPPRITESRTTGPISRILALCDAVFIPLLGSGIDASSTLDFLRLVDAIGRMRESAGVPLVVYGFINRWSSRGDNAGAKSYLESRGLKMFEHSLHDLKIFASPSPFRSIMDTTEGRRRFGYFFSEFCKTFKIR